MRFITGSLLVFCPSVFVDKALWQTYLQLFHSDKYTNLHLKCQNSSLTETGSRPITITVLQWEYLEMHFMDRQMVDRDCKNGF